MSEIRNAILVAKEFRDLTKHNMSERVREDCAVDKYLDKIIEHLHKAEAHTSRGHFTLIYWLIGGLYIFDLILSSAVVFLLS